MIDFKLLTLKLLKKIEILNYVHTYGKEGFDAIVTTPRNCLNWRKKKKKEKKKQQKTSHVI